LIDGIAALLGSNSFFKAIVTIVLGTLARNGIMIVTDILLNNAIMTTIREALGGIAIGLLVVTALRDSSVQVATTPSSIHSTADAGAGDEVDLLLVGARSQSRSLMRSKRHVKSWTHMSVNGIPDPLAAARHVVGD
jgi:hypothetical protein